MCRQEIPRDFIEHPNLLQAPQCEIVEGFDGGYQWFYEGRNGGLNLFVHHVFGYKSVKMVMTLFLFVAINA